MLLVHWSGGLKALTKHWQPLVSSEGMEISIRRLALGSDI